MKAKTRSTRTILSSQFDVCSLRHSLFFLPIGSNHTVTAARPSLSLHPQTWGSPWRGKQAWVGWPWRSPPSPALLSATIVARWLPLPRCRCPRPPPHGCAQLDCPRSGPSISPVRGTFMQLLDSSNPRAVWILLFGVIEIYLIN